ncbi:hypothetical protein EW146_g9463 [Bondarzewia mesenterica]|uniref:Integrase core domain-containing protein n=1 Tax=Bondarzewia mesenterica TaxID=1095465 RepID=A0A4S4L617_9AGAM|nr:hypothetical protein EW146_g9463 [Bondarzewia mesenterica]
MADILDNLRAAYQTLNSRALAYLAAAEQHSRLFDAMELSTLHQSVADMVTALDAACHQSSDYPDRPQLDITPFCVKLCLCADPPASLPFSSAVLEPSVIVRSIWGLLSPAIPYILMLLYLMVPSNAHTPRKHCLYFPTLAVVCSAVGWRHPVTMSRERGSLLPTHASTAHQPFLAIVQYIAKFIKSLVRILCGITMANMVKSRLVTGICVSNNNRADTVLDLFRDAVQIYGWPSRVRGDHGTENVLIAREMEAMHGADHGSYIWGRSVHNTWIERLWYDVTHGYGQKWKDFFLDLETHYGLDPTNAVHIWLLHHLFLPQLVKAQGPLAIFFFFSMIEDGVRGVLPSVSDDAAVDPASYGIDWEVAGEPRYMNHLLANNTDELENANLFFGGRPRLSHVPCDAPTCPMTPDQLIHLNAALRMRVNLESRSMLAR